MAIKEKEVMKLPLLTALSVALSVLDPASADASVAATEDDIVS